VAKDFLPQKKKEDKLSNCEFIISGDKEFVLECIDKIKG